MHLWLTVPGVPPPGLQPHKTSSVATLPEAMRVLDGQYIGGSDQVSHTLHLLEMVEERHGEAEVVMIGLGIGPDLPVIVPPDTVAYYQAKDGSIVMEIRRHREGGRMTIFLEQAWPDGRMYRETESCFVSSLDQLRRLPHAEQ